MTAGVFSLLVVTVAFTALVIWAFHPRNRERLREHGLIPFKDDIDE